MKKTRFTEEQMVTILREADERPVPEVAEKHGVSAQTIYGWRKHFGTLEPTDMKRLRQLEQDNGRLKKMVADRDLALDVGFIVTNLQLPNRAVVRFYNKRRTAEQWTRLERCPRNAAKVRRFRAISRWNGS